MHECDSYKNIFKTKKIQHKIDGIIFAIEKLEFYEQKCDILISTNDSYTKHINTEINGDSDDDSDDDDNDTNSLTTNETKETKLIN